VSRIQNIKTANIAHTNLAIFASIVNLLEGGVIEGESADKAKQKIINICKQEQGRQLIMIDKATHKILRDQS